MAKSLSEDLRALIVAVESGMSRRAAAERFGVSAASAVRWPRRSRQAPLLPRRSIPKADIDLTPPANGHSGPRWEPCMAEWQAHESPDFEPIMLARCAALLADIKARQDVRLSILNGPAHLHRDLYQDFTPRGFSDYAGTYRGTPNTNVAQREAGAEFKILFAGSGRTYSFVPAAKVLHSMEQLSETAIALVTNQREASTQKKLLMCSMIFFNYGNIHPFADGNGHTQRAYLAALATELGLTLNSRFAIHPRPFGRLLALAFECSQSVFKASPDYESIAEYLAAFFDEFDCPRGNIATG